MSTMEIVLLIVGALAFIVSFFINDKKNEYADNLGASEDEIRQLVADEYERTKQQLDDISEETINYSMEKAERKLERISNEKMLAMGEYSDSILNQISTNHQETVFLHDMLSRNKDDLTNMLGQAMKDASEAQLMAQKALEDATKAAQISEGAVLKAEEAANSSVLAEEKMIDARKAISAQVDSDSEKTSKTEKKPRKSTKKKTEVEEESFTQMSLQFDTEGENSVNNNDRILRLHEIGKSNVAIARELGLGVGEVNLVINLFKK